MSSWVSINLCKQNTLNTHPVYPRTPSRPLFNDFALLYVILKILLLSNQREFYEAIRVYLILVDNSAQWRNPQTWPKVPPSRLKGDWNRPDLASLVVSGCRMLLSKSALITPARLALNLFRRFGCWLRVDLFPIPPIFGSSGVGRVHSDPSSSSLPSWVTLQELGLQTASPLGITGKSKPSTMTRNDHILHWMSGWTFRYQMYHFDLLLL